MTRDGNLMMGMGAQQHQMPVQAPLQAAAPPQLVPALAMPLGAVRQGPAAFTPGSNTPAHVNIVGQLTLMQDQVGQGTSCLFEAQRRLVCSLPRTDITFLLAPLGPVQLSFMWYLHDLK